MCRILFILLIVLFITAALTAPARAGADPRIEVFTSAEYPVTHREAFTDVIIHRVDQFGNLLEGLSQGLPADPDQAAQAVRERLATQGGLSGQMMDAGNGLVRAIEYGLDRYPAVILDGRYLVYGVTDLQRVRRLYERSTTQ